NLHLFFKGKKDIIDCYDTAIVSCNDRIFPEKNQINFWEGRAKIIRCQNAPHFIFYNWESWEDLLKYASGN
ncbi:MAG: DUF452 family protein, partial [Candidatus Delongbacteria bacterium]|nr:DUF452 family protein [Candidatus Delongbacteria bacterium]